MRLLAPTLEVRHDDADVRRRGRAFIVFALAHALFAAAYAVTIPFRYAEERTRLALFGIVGALIAVQLGSIALARRGRVGAGVGVWGATLLVAIVLVGVSIERASSSSWTAMICVAASCFMVRPRQIVLMALGSFAAYGFLVAWLIWQIGSLEAARSNADQVVTFAALMAFATALSLLSATASRQAEREAAERSEAVERAKEREARLRERAERAARAKQEFLATVSHELRTPLNAILGYSEIMCEDLARRADQSERSLERDSGRITKAGQHLLDLIERVLDAAQLESARAELDLELWPVEPLARQVEALVALDATARANQLQIEIEPPELCLRSDATRVRQILVNLLGNAAKFTQGGLIELTARPHEGGVRFEVRDTGIGMSVEQLERALRDFEQAERSTAREYGGSGIGLPLTRRVVERLGGTMRLESAPGRGTRAIIDLPDLTSEAP